MTFHVGESVVLPSGNIAKIEHIDFDTSDQGIYWLDNGLFCYKFEMRKIEESK